MQFNFAEKVGSLTEERRARFYRHFATNLAIAARWIYGAEGWAAADKVERFSRLNEILHRAIPQGFALQFGGFQWSDKDFEETISLYVGGDKELLTLVERVIDRTYASVNTGSDQVNPQ